MVVDALIAYACDNNFSNSEARHPVAVPFVERIEGGAVAAVRGVDEFPVVCGGRRRHAASPALEGRK